MKLLHATGNLFKYTLMKERLKVFKDIELVNPNMLGIKINVIEDGKTAEENSIKKAKAYYEAAKIPIIAEDTGLIIEKFKEEEQPRLYVKRVNGIDDLSDEEILKYYIDKLNTYGGESLAYYYTGVSVVDFNGNVYSNTINETKFLLTSRKCSKKDVNGGVLNCISYDINCNKYFDERTLEEKQEHYKKLDEQYRALIKKYILN